ncbi:MAG: MFS transporter [Kiritimatiellales bacterium]|nr:MFS transporter [Kiritimatiellales bacterium]
MTEGKYRQENPLFSILINLVIPVGVLSFLSKEKYLGPVWALVVGLAFPISYGLRTLIRDRKADFMAIIGIVSVTLTGVFGILKLPPEYIAVKEAAIPLIIGLVIVISLKTPFPLIKKLLMTEALFDVERLKRALKEKNSEATFERRLVGLTWGLASSMFLSAGLSYTLAKIVLKSEPGTEAFTAELGKMTGLSHVVVLVPCLVVMLFVMNKLFDTLSELTGLKLDDLLAARHKQKPEPVAAVDPQED